jgi:hypothetical protein
MDREAKTGTTFRGSKRKGGYLLLVQNLKYSGKIPYNGAAE